jgi:hypothetical protein
VRRTQFRQGIPFDDALTRIEEARTLDDSYLVYPALAMTQYRLGNSDEARHWLDTAEISFTDATLGDAESQKIASGAFWQDWAYFEALLLEAREVIGGEK